MAAPPLILFSLAVNAAVAGTMGTCLLAPALTPPALDLPAVYGPDTPARRVLACLYLSITATSVAALAHAPWRLPVARVLFPLQIAYKVATAAVVDLANPVPQWNLAIAALHTVALVKATRGV